MVIIKNKDHHGLLNYKNNHLLHYREIKMSSIINNQTFSSIVTFQSAPVMSGTSITSATIPIASVVGTAMDLTTAQTVGGIKTFSSAPVMSGASITSGTIPAASVVNTSVTLSDTQTISGTKTFSTSPVFSTSPTVGFVWTCNDVSGTAGWAASASFTWSTVTGTTQAMSASNGYVANNASLVTLTLPATASVGDTFIIVGLGAGGYRIAQRASQLIRFGSAVTTTGTGGSLSSTNQYDTIRIVCIVANTTFSVVDSVSAGFNVV